LVYENVSNVGLIYDTSTGLTWTQDADLSGATFTFGDANAWATGLAITGLTGWSFELPTVAEFTSLYTQLDPYGAPGAPGADHKYGVSVSFGSGSDDVALNVQTTYWTVADGVDFNFFYGYDGSASDSTAYAAWAVTAAPEPSGAMLLLAGIATIGLFRFRRETAAR
jgi:hypothetical protein